LKETWLVVGNIPYKLLNRDNHSLVGGELREQIIASSCGLTLYVVF
jgi:tryptophan synthase beta subunit